MNYEFDAYAKNNSRKIGGIVKGSSDATTFVSSETLGEHQISAEIGADFICTENFSFNLNADYVLADGGNQYSYGGGFRLVFWDYLICNKLHNRKLKNYLLFFRLNKVPKFNRCLINYWIDFKRNS